MKSRPFHIDGRGFSTGESKLRSVFIMVVIFLITPVIFYANKSIVEKEIYRNDIFVKGYDEAKFKVELPSGWTVKFSNDMKLNINGEKKRGKITDKATIKVGFDVMKYRNDVPPEYIDKIKKYYVSIMEPKLAKEGVKQSEGSIGEFKGSKLEYRLNIGNSVYKYWQYIARISNEDIAIITCTAPEGNFKDFEEDFKSIVDSMDFDVVVK